MRKHRGNVTGRRQLHSDTGRTSEHTCERQRTNRIPHYTAVLIVPPHSGGTCVQPSRFLFPAASSMKTIAKPLTKAEISRGRQIAAAIVADNTQSAARQIAAIELDNFLSGDAPMPGGGPQEIRARIRFLKNLLPQYPTRILQPLTPQAKVQAEGAT